MRKKSTKIVFARGFKGITSNKIYTKEKKRTVRQS